MELINIKVPENVRYISEWLDFNLPQGLCIIDKNVTGCGFTEYCLTNNLNVILCSPRKVLLENKEEQHKGDLNILYLRNELEKGEISTMKKINGTWFEFRHFGVPE